MSSILDWGSLGSPVGDGGAAALQSMDDSQIATAQGFDSGPLFTAANDGINDLVASFAAAQQAGKVDFSTLQKAQANVGAAYQSTDNPLVQFIFADYLSYVFEQARAAYYQGVGADGGPAAGSVAPKPQFADPSFADQLGLPKVGDLGSGLKIGAAVAVVVLVLVVIIAVKR